MADRAARPAESRSPPPQVVAVSDFLTLLARALQRFHTYPADSPLCAEAIADSHRSLASVEASRLRFRVTEDSLVLEDTPIPVPDVVLTQVVRRLYRADVAELVVEREATARDLSRFCAEVVRRDRRRDERGTLADALDERGISNIQVGIVRRLEVLDLGRPDPAALEHVRAEQAHRETDIEAHRRALSLYPKGSGCVRVDPSCTLESVSLADLAVLLEDPLELARMLHRLSEAESDEAEDPEAALEEKYSEITSLLSALRPGVARRLFARLARSVLALRPDRRSRLIRETILLGLLDGSAVAAVLPHFPDAELATSLSLLLETEAAAAGSLDLILQRLDLSEERREAVAAHLVSGRTETHGAEEDEPRFGADSPIPGEDLLGMDSTGITGYAEGAIRVDHSEGKDFRDFAAVDLATDEAANQALGRFRTVVAETDERGERLRCLANLLRAEPNPDLAEAYLDLASKLLEEVAETERPRVFLDWVGRQRAVAAEVEDGHPEVAGLVGERLEALCTPALMSQLSRWESQGTPEDAEVARKLVRTLGGHSVPALVRLLESESDRARRRAVVRLMSRCASVLAPAIATRTEHEDWRVTRNLVSVLGFAGAGQESAVAHHLDHPEVRVAKEAIRALARIRTPLAADLVARQVSEGRPALRSSAAKALWRFPVEEARREVKKLLSRQRFVLSEPRFARQLLDRAAEHGLEGLRPVLLSLQSLRRRFWRPQLLRLGYRARTLLRRLER